MQLGMNWARLAGAFFALIAVGFGAFAAHGLREHLSEAQLRTFEVGVRYQFYHALALILVGSIGPRGKLATASAVCFVVGIVCFSGSLYLLATQDGWRWLGPVTPLGGVLFLVGWGLTLFRYALDRDVGDPPSR